MVSSHPSFMMESIRAASLAFLVYEICITLEQEINYIWMQVILSFSPRKREYPNRVFSRPHTCWRKWHYLFARYFALLALVINRTFDRLGLMHKEILPPPFDNWFSCQVIIAGSLIMSLELMLMVRVYALYGRPNWIACTFAAFLVCEVSLAITGLFNDQKFSTPKMQQGATERGPNSFVYFGIAAMLSQSTVLLLTVIKYNSFKAKIYPFSPYPKLVLQEESIGFSVMISVTVWTLLSAITDRFVPIIDSWFLAIVSCAL
ncbi:hypothetical protein D9756_007676 [Leucocoprinus leucothites]|uniref:DUF6533 domain-containing protein n=1 Tax=Leucocoprinus leucothites TaxID=201217 RepID=A0A8H5FWV6_9AGAR|nr:hypothetical protein D9756_007676 [Leucoagaricus leucothites]